MTPRYCLRTLLILLAVMPPLLWIGWGKYQAWRAEQERVEALQRVATAPPTIGNYYARGSRDRLAPHGLSQRHSATRIH